MGLNKMAGIFVFFVYFSLPHTHCESRAGVSGLRPCIPWVLCSERSHPSLAATGVVMSPVKSDTGKTTLDRCFLCAFATKKCLFSACKHFDARFDVLWPHVSSTNIVLMACCARSAL